MAWVRSLDEMRLQDLATIQQLERRIAQWESFAASGGVPAGDAGSSSWARQPAQI